MMIRLQTHLVRVTPDPPNAQVQLRASQIEARAQHAQSLNRSSAATIVRRHGERKRDGSPRRELRSHDEPKRSVIIAGSAQMPEAGIPRSISQVTP